MAGSKKHTTKIPPPKDAQIRKAIDYGIDISILLDNLNRTPAERLKRHQAALDAVQKLRKAKNI